MLGRHSSTQFKKVLNEDLSHDTPPETLLLGQEPDRGEAERDLWPLRSAGFVQLVTFGHAVVLWGFPYALGLHYHDRRQAAYSWLSERAHCARVQNSCFPLLGAPHHGVLQAVMALWVDRADVIYEGCIMVHTHNHQCGGFEDHNLSKSCCCTDPNKAYMKPSIG